MNFNNNSCLWIILILLFCGCGENGFGNFGNCGCGCENGMNIIAGLYQHHIHFSFSTAAEKKNNDNNPAIIHTVFTATTTVAEVTKSVFATATE